MRIKEQQETMKAVNEASGAISEKYFRGNGTKSSHIKESESSEYRGNTTKHRPCATDKVHQA